MVLETKNKFKRLNKTVLLFSGGMDCVCVNQIYKPDVLLHIKYGGKYSLMEEKSIKNLIESGAIDKDKLVTIDIGSWLGLRERDDLIIPNRNSIFVLLASEFGDTIWLASVKGDRSKDKDIPFFDCMERLLDHTWEEQHWCEARSFKVCSPVKNLTKTELIEEFLNKCGKREWLLSSYSCYSGTEKPCGQCKPCIRKAIALSNSNIIIPDDYFINDPKSNAELLSMREIIVNGKYRGEEDKDICKFMGWKYNDEI